MNLKATYNRIAADWHQDHQRDDWWVDGTKAFCSYLPTDTTVLDVGCGSGQKAKFLTEQGLRVTGVDFSQTMIEIARREVPAAAFQILDIRNLDALGTTYGGVFAQAVLLHFFKKEIPALVRTLTGRVAPGGYLYVAVKERRGQEPDEEVKTEADYGYPYERFFSYFSLLEMEDYLRQAGLEIVHRDRTQFNRTVWIQLIGRKV